VTEEWRRIPNTTYSVSNLGRVQTQLGQILRFDRHHKGYLYVKLHGKKIHVARLVCEVFNGPPPFEGAMVRHLDGSRSNNVPVNLAWGTGKDNADDREKHGNTSRGPVHSLAVRGRLTCVS
jgi:hypothetical protein